MSVLISGLGGKCLDIPGGATANGTPIIIFDRHGGTNQQWNLNGARMLVSQHAPGKCLTVNGPGNAGDGIVLSDINGGPNQKWTLQSDGTLVTDLRRDRCIDIPNGVDRSGTAITLWQKHGGINQRWSYIAGSSVPFEDGVLIASPPDISVYVIESGKRRGIPNSNTFNSLGYRWEDIQYISAGLMNSIPSGAIIPTQERINVDTGYQPLLQPGLGHMHTRAELSVSTGHIDAVTRTRADSWFGGYHGGVQILLLDDRGFAVQGGAIPMEIFGVDGSVIGRSDRTDAWTADISPAEAAKVGQIVVNHTVVTANYQAILEKWLRSGKAVTELLVEIATVAQSFFVKK